MKILNQIRHNFGGRILPSAAELRGGDTILVAFGVVGFFAIAINVVGGAA